MNPFEYPFVIKQVREWLIVSVPDLEITVSDIVDMNSKVDMSYVTVLNRLQLKAAKLVLEKMMRLKSSGIKPKSSPSFIRNSIQAKNKDEISTKAAAKYLGISEATLKRWETSGRLKSFKTAGGHRKFNLGELDRIKKIMESGERPLTQKDESDEKIRRLVGKNLSFMNENF